MFGNALAKMLTMFITRGLTCPGNLHFIFRVTSYIAEFLQWIGMVFIKTTTLFYIHPPQFSRFIMSGSLWPRGLQHARPPCPSPTPRACSNSCPLSWWCHLANSSSVVPFTSCLEYFPASGSFLMNQFFASSGQSVGASASALVLRMNIQDWLPLGLADWISLQSKGLSRIFSNTTVQKHQLFGALLSLWSNSHIHIWLLEKS